MHKFSCSVTIQILQHIIVSFTENKLMEGQVIQLEDGSAAYVQHLPMSKTGISYGFPSNGCSSMITDCLIGLF